MGITPLPDFHRARRTGRTRQFEGCQCRVAGWAELLESMQRNHAVVDRQAGMSQTATILVRMLAHEVGTETSMAEIEPASPYPAAPTDAAKSLTAGSLVVLR